MSEIIEDKRINPRITDAEVGVRCLRTIKLYPLSVGDQLELTDIITDAFQQFYTKGADNPNDKEFIGFILGLVKKHLSKIVTLLTCGEEPPTILKEITNEQLVDIVQKVYAVNFDCIQKNLTGLSGKLQNPLQSERPLATSVNTTLDTGLNISTGETTNKEE